MKFQIFTVDAFSDKPFSGNPAAVVPLTQPLDDETLQKVATELNLSETSFLRPPEGDEMTQDVWSMNSRFSLRWFTPVSEIPLCGHATLSAAHVLFQEMGNKNEVLEFETLSGVLVVRRTGGGITMDFPSNPPRPLTPAEDKEMAPIVRASSGNLEVEEVLLAERLKYLMVVLKKSHTKKDLESIQPMATEMKNSHPLGTLTKAVIVCIAGEGTEPFYHVLSRFFAPWYGVVEDPVTGSAHTVLGPYWSSKLGVKELECRQCSPRGGDVSVKIVDAERVHITGKAVTVIEGTISM